MVLIGHIVQAATLIFSLLFFISSLKQKGDQKNESLAYAQISMILSMYFAIILN